jgi:hypothetical protein
MVFVTLANLEKSGMRALVTALDVVDSPVIAAYQLGIAGDFRGSDWPRYVTLIATGTRPASRRSLLARSPMPAPLPPSQATWGSTWARSPTRASTPTR